MVTSLSVANGQGHAITPQPVQCVDAAELACLPNRRGSRHWGTTRDSCVLDAKAGCDKL